MFTGIVQTQATIFSVSDQASFRHIVVGTEPKFLKDLAIGASIAINGCCLTVVEFSDTQVHFDVIDETLRLTNLGKLKDGFSKYHADLTMIQALEDCIEHPESANVKTQLEEALAHKKSQLSASLANAFAYEEGLRKALSIGNNPLPQIHVTEYNYAVNALERFTRILERWNYTKEPDDPSEMIKMLGRLERSNYLPDLFRTMLDYAHKLDAMRDQLPEIPEALHCPNDSVPQKAEQLRDSFNNIYIKEMQGDIAEVIEQHQRLLMTLENLQGIAPQPALKDYIAELGKLSKVLTDATVHFVRPWQRFYSACNFTPAPD